MTPESQRIAIAEACGWTYIEKLGLTGIPKGSLWGSADADVIPDYLSDLNACHEMEKALGDKFPDYIVNLICVANKIPHSKFHWPALGFDASALDSLVHAKAAQKSKAFLRTLGKWVE